MKRNDVLQILTAIKPELVNRFGITKLALFGSTARDQAKTGSDLDVLVAFDETTSSSKYFGVLFLLEDQLGCRVDLVTEKALRAELKPYIEKDAIYV